MPSVIIYPPFCLLTHNVLLTGSCVMFSHMCMQSYESYISYIPLSLQLLFLYSLPHSSPWMIVTFFFSLLLMDICMDSSLELSQDSVYMAYSVGKSYLCSKSGLWGDIIQQHQLLKTSQFSDLRISVSQLCLPPGFMPMDLPLSGLSPMTLWSLCH